MSICAGYAATIRPMKHNPRRRVIALVLITGVLAATLSSLGNVGRFLVPVVVVVGVLWCKYEAEAAQRFVAGREAERSLGEVPPPE